MIMAFVCGSVHAKSNVSTSVTSPDKHIEIRISQDHDQHVLYEVLVNDKRVVAPSQLGFELANNQFLASFDITSSAISSFSDTWETVWGENKQIQNTYNELALKLVTRTSNIVLNLHFRAYNDGIAFRYSFPQQSQLSHFVIMDELTEFRLDKMAKTWWLEANYDSYEKPYQHTSLALMQHANTPITLKNSEDLYISIHEAALTNYASMTLMPTRNISAEQLDTQTLEAHLVPWKDGSKVKASTPFKTPWRTIQLSNTPQGLLESNLILNLNEPNKLADTRWINPMTYIGIWWGIHAGVHTWKVGPRHGATTARAMEYIDFASDNNIGGVLFEGWNKGWENWGDRDAYVVPAEDFDLEKVANYAKRKGVMIIGHNETGGNVEAYEKHVEEIFSIYSNLGINAVKTGYVAESGFANGEHHQGQWGVNHYRRILEIAAKYKIMLNVHEPIKDTGIRRTWPHMMTREGVRGGEWNAWSEGNPLDHTLIIPFTRLLSGPVDYTPGIFDVDFSNFSGQRYDWSGRPQTAEYRVKSTLTRQLAEMIILYSPLQMAADMIENYRGQPAFDLIKKLTNDYDESLIPHAEIGEYITYARRSGSQWFVASATNETHRTLELKLDFLSEGNEYRATIYQDTLQTHWKHNPERYEVVKKSA